MMIFLALIGGSTWQARFARIEPRFLAATALLFAVRLAVIAAVWFQGGKLYARLMPALDALPRGSCVAVAFGKDSIQVAKAPLTHFTTLAVARRDAFVTTIFHYPLQQPIALKPEAERLADLLSPDLLWYHFVDDFDAAHARRQSRARGMRPCRLRRSASLRAQEHGRAHAGIRLAALPALSRDGRRAPRRPPDAAARAASAVVARPRGLGGRRRSRACRCAASGGWRHGGRAHPGIGAARRLGRRASWC